MKSKICVILIFIVLLSACADATSAPAEVTAVQPASAPESNPNQSDTPAAATMSPAETLEPSRKAVITEVEKNVSLRLAADASPSPATAGTTILPGGIVETGSDGRARLDLLPDGTIVRLGPNSSFLLTEITEVNGAPQTTLELFFGKIYILLNGGTLNVKTPSGVAAVQGSVLGVEYDPETDRFKASCLEGHCSLEDENGNEVELTEGESSYIEEGEPPVEPEEIDSEEIQEWLDEVPEMPEFFEELPNPEDYPEPEATEEVTEVATEDPLATVEPEVTEEPPADDSLGGDSGAGGGEPDPGGGEPDPSGGE
jgi:hypothetical protein